MPQIIPALLVTSAEELKTQIKSASKLSSHLQIDVGDGFFVPYKTPFTAKNLMNIKTDAKYELHLMVDYPIEEIKKWQKIKNIFRIVFHIECKDKAADCINAIKKSGWEAGIAINPSTQLTAIDHYCDLIDVVLFMTVNPGEQGQKFMAEVGDKIKLFARNTKRPLCAIDGGINKENIAEAAVWGVEIFNVGSALFKSGKNIKEAYLELTKQIKAT